MPLNQKVRYAFDNDVGDDAPPVELGLFEVERTALEGHNTYVQAGASGGSNRKTSGLLDYWSLSEYRVVGDYDDDHLLTVADVDILMTRVRKGPFSGSYDLNEDGVLDSSDVRVWVEDLKNTWFGDANLDSEFNSTDLVEVFKGGQYEDGIALNSTWGTGDWNADGEFKSGDLVFAFAGGGYEFGPRAEIAIVAGADIVCNARHWPKRNSDRLKKLVEPTID